MFQADSRLGNVQIFNVVSVNETSLNSGSVKQTNKKKIFVQVTVHYIVCGILLFIDFLVKKE